MDPPRRAALTDLLQSLFNNSELLAFVASIEAGHQLRASLPDASVPLVQLLDCTIGLLERHGYVHTPLFTALAAARPLCRADIDSVAAMFPTTALGPKPPRDPQDYSTPDSLYDGDL